ncbi:DNA gyrase subunit B [Kitasatospora sp. NPDC097605]|uniref:DNA gyrase subunit B n=1 Tax=Kitasatospora sp. NPDC097605 TaxID=3157226 RepID=UPI003324529C
MSEGTTGYETARIQVLEGLEAVRKRPGMYVGSTGEHGLHNLLFSVTHRAVNEVLAGRTRRVDVTLMSDGWARVADDGPGDPVEAPLTRMQAGKPPLERHDVSAGYIGLELFVANALSSRLTAEVRRAGVRWVQEYARGVALTPPTEAGPASRSGTSIAFRPDDEIFQVREFSFDALADHFRELAFLNQALEISLSDRRHPAEPREERYRFPGGARDFVAFLDGGDGPDDDIFGFEHEAPRMAGTLEVALRWRAVAVADGGERIRTFANSRPTNGGGTHDRGFRTGVAAALTAHARRHHLLPAAAPDLDADRVGAGLTAVVSVKLDDVEFEGATKDVLGNTAVRGCVEEAVRDHLGQWLVHHPEGAAAVIGRLLGRE